MLENLCANEDDNDAVDLIMHAHDDDGGVGGGGRKAELMLSRKY